MVGGFSPTPLKNDGVKVSWDDEIPNIWNHKQMFQTTKQFFSPLKPEFLSIGIYRLPTRFFSQSEGRDRSVRLEFIPPQFLIKSQSSH